MCFKPSPNKRWVAQRKRGKTKNQIPGGIIFHPLSLSLLNSSPPVQCTIIAAGNNQLSALSFQLVVCAVYESLTWGQRIVLMVYRCCCACCIKNSSSVWAGVSGNSSSRILEQEYTLILLLVFGVAVTVLLP